MTIRAFSEERSVELRSAEQLRHFGLWWAKHLIGDWATLHRFGVWREHPREISTWLQGGGLKKQGNHLDELATMELQNLPGLPSFLRFLEEIGIYTNEAQLIARAKHFSSRPHDLQRIQLEDVIERWVEKRRHRAMGREKSREERET